MCEVSRLSDESYILHCLDQGRSDGITSTTVMLAGQFRLSKLLCFGY